MLTLARTCPLLLCLLLCLARGDGKPAWPKDPPVHQVTIIREEHEDDPENFDYDHEVFLGREDKKRFDQMTPEESKRKLGNIVDKIDKNADGFVTMQELKDWLQYAQTKHIYSQIETRFTDYDIDKDGRISWTEYRNNTYGVHLGEDTEVLGQNDQSKMIQRDRRRFAVASRDGTMRLNLDEFANFHHPEHFVRMFDTVVLEVLEDIDSNEDGSIDEDEYIGDMYKDRDEDEKPEWVSVERDQFKEYRDKNGDGVMDLQEIREWIFPLDHDYRENEAKHLVNASDTDLDGKLTKAEILDKYQIFVGSHLTNYGDNLLMHEEL